MKNQPYRAPLAMVVAFLFACGGTEPAQDERIPAEVPAAADDGGLPPVEDYSPVDLSDVLKGEVTALEHGCPRDPYACVHHCQTSGLSRLGSCTGVNRKTCTCGKVK